MDSDKDNILSLALDQTEQNLGNKPDRFGTLVGDQEYKKTTEMGLQYFQYTAKK